MKKILLALILVLALAVPAMAFDINKDFKVEGDVNLGYVFSDSYNTNIEGVTVPDTVGSDQEGSKWGYMADIKLVYKDTFRPWVYLQGISGYSVNAWKIATQTCGLGLDYFFYKTNYGSAYARVSYTNWQTEANVDAFGMNISASPESDTWMMGIGWKF